MARLSLPDGHLRLDGIEKADELLIAMALHVAADHHAVETRPERQIENAPDRLRRQRRLAGRPRFVAQKPVNALLHQALLPAPDHRLGLARATHRHESVAGLSKKVGLTDCPSLKTSN